jgi:hypothetical protein
VKQELKDSICFSLSFDETTDINSISQLSVIARFVSKDLNIRTEFLSLLPLMNRTRGQDVCDALTHKDSGIFSQYELDPFKLVSVSTDGAPSMRGKNIGAVKLLRDHIYEATNQENNLISFHCIIHQLALCGQIEENTFDGKVFSEVINVVLKVINSLKGKSATVSRDFRSYIDEMFADVTYNRLFYITCKFLIVKICLYFY